MRGASKTPIPYVCEADRPLDEKEQTVFWLRGKNIDMGNQSLARYARAQKDRVDGGKEWEPVQLSRADVEDFLAVCVRVDNYAFTPEYLSSHPDVQVLSEKNGGFYPKGIIDYRMLEDVARDLPSGAFNEIMGASANQIRLNAGAKKNLSFSPSLLSGEAPLPSAPEITTAASV